MKRLARGMAVCSIVAISLAIGLLPHTVDAQTSQVSVRDQADAKASALVSQMTLDEKVNQLLNVAPAIPRLNIPAYNWWTESLHGANASVPTTNFPEPIGLAATFDAPLLKDVAGAISVELRALHTRARETGQLGVWQNGLDTWSPNINIFRDPRWGRGQETYGEDPYLTANMGLAFVQGMQGPNPDLPYVIATPKHFAVHSGPESTRHVADVFVSAHDLEDTYLPAFRAVLVDGKAGSTMCAYNRIDGQPACASQLLLKDHLRGAWDFKGYVVSDCDAVTDISQKHKYANDPVTAVAVALKAGVDNECNTRALFHDPGLADRYKQAYARGLISMEDIDRAVTRLFSARYRTGDLLGIRQDAPVPATEINSSEHQALALTTAVKSMVLLKNDGILPLKPNVKIAVIGPLGDATRVLRGNYSTPLSMPPVSVVDGLRQALPNADIVLVPFGESITDGDPVPSTALRTANGKVGLQAAYYNARSVVPAAASGEEPAIVYEDKPFAARIEPGIDARGDDFKAAGDHYKIVWTGYLVPQATGSYRIGLSGDKGEFVLDGKTITRIPYAEWGRSLDLVTTVELEKGHRYPLSVTTEVAALPHVALTWKLVSTQPEADLKAGVEDADIVVAAVGLTSDLEGEESSAKYEGFAAGDRTTLDLPADQRRMLEQAKALGKPIIMVLMNGSPINLSWAKTNAAAILEAWYPGQQGGLAIADVLSGKANPAGRLPLTFYESVADLPAFDDYSMKGRTYRYFSGTPVYPFGYGLSYTRFSYSPLKIDPVDGHVENGINVTTEITNRGERAGDEVAELYVTPPAFDGAPQLALRGFQRISLKPGEQRQVTFSLSPRDLSFVTRDGVRQLMPGEHKISVGSGQPGFSENTESGTVVISQAIMLPK